MSGRGWWARVRAESDRWEQLRTRLWNAPANGDETEARRYPAALLEQYKIYVEMADRVSQRRAAANAFFLSLNTALSTLVAAMLAGGPARIPWWLVFPLLAILAQCFSWFSLLRAYRLLNAAKYEVVGALEERLPASPYWQAEWWALGEGRQRGLYRPISQIEQGVPILFACTYVGAFLVVLVR